MLLITVCALAIQIPDVTVRTRIDTVKSAPRLVTIPAPEGFHEIRHSSAYVWRLMESMVAPTNRLLAAFVSKVDFDAILRGDLPELRRYMLVKVSRGFEANVISRTEFGEVARLVKQERAAVVDSLKTSINSERFPGSEKRSKESDARVERGELEFLGVFFESSDAIGHGTLKTVQRYEGETPLGETVAGSMSFVRAADKLIYVHVYSVYRDSADLQWVRAASSFWINDILAANSVSPVLEGPDTTAAARSLDTVRDKTAFWALFGIVLVSVAILFQFIHRFRRRTT